MFNIRIYEIDFTSENILPADGSFLGYQGEHNATTLSIIPPAEMTECEDIVAYKVAFMLCNCRHTRSETLEKTSPVEILLSSTITSSKEISVQLEGYGADGNLVVKSPLVTKLTFEDSVGGVSVDYNSQGGTAADVAANTLARHTHENADVLNGFSEDESGILFYNGEEIRQTIDSDLSETSENAVQNKVITAKFNELAEKSHEHAHIDVLEKFSTKEDGTLLYDGKEIGQSETSGNTEITVDAVLSDSSENPVQNKIISAKIKSIMSILADNDLLELKAQLFANDYSEGVVSPESDKVVFYVCDTEYSFADKQIKKITFTAGDIEYELSDTAAVNEDAVVKIIEEPYIDDTGYFRVAEVSNISNESLLYNAVNNYNPEITGFTLYYYEI